MRSALRSLIYIVRAKERKIINRLRVNRSGWLKHILRPEMFVVSRDRISQGLAVGFFWAFIPMPLQMIPATFFCWLVRANLPIALICVWISNPITYIPIFYIEYQVGVMLFGGGDIGWQEFQQLFSDQEVLGKIFYELGLPLFRGALVMSVGLALLSYLIGLLAFDYIAAKKRKKRHASEN